MIPPSAFQAPGSPWTSIVGLVFLGLVIVGLAVSGWQSSPYFWHKTSFLVVALGIPLIAVALWIGWIFAKPKVVASTGGRIQSLWTNDGPRYAAAPPTDPDAGARRGSGRMRKETAMWKTLTLTVVALTTLAACGADATGPTADPTLVEGAQKGGSLTIGIPFDNPGLGLDRGREALRLRRRDGDLRRQGARR